MPLYNPKVRREFQEKLLQWYDQNRRRLPWRALAGEEPNPYHVWLSEIMLQQTTVGAVKNYFEKFINQWPSLLDFASAKDVDIMREWAGLGYYARARNMIKCAKVIKEQYGGQFPQDIKELQALPGVGAYTASAIATIAFFKPAVVIDANIERIAARLFEISESLPKSKPHIRHQAAWIFRDLETLSCNSSVVFHRHADMPQALMDLGATICVPISPKCSLCPISKFCLSYEHGKEREIPVRAIKNKRPHRHGQVYWVENEHGQVLIERRVETRMLGGMLGFPDTDWDEKGQWASQTRPCFSSQVFCKPEIIYKSAIKHVFTHFSLELDIIKCRCSSKNVEYIDDPNDREGIKNMHLKSEQFFANKESLPSFGFPSLFKKLVNYMRQISCILLIVMAFYSIQFARAETDFERKHRAKLEKLDAQKKELDKKMDILNKEGTSQVLEEDPDRTLGVDHRNNSVIRFVRGSHENIARMLWKFSVYDLSNTEDIDNYILLSDCKTYAFNYDDEFKWRKIQLATVEYLRKYSPSFSTFIEVTQPLELDRYNFDLQGFPLKNPQELANVTAIQIADEKQQGGLDCRIDRKSSKRYTQSAVLNLIAPINIYFIPATHELARAYLDFLAKQPANKVEKFAYVRYRLRVDGFSKFETLNGVGDAVIFNGKVLQVDIFADSDFFLPLFSQKYE